MKSVVFYAYPPENDGTSLQGHLLYKGILKTGNEALSCHFQESIEKRFVLKHYKPDVAFGVGFWGNVPEIVKAPFRYGITPVPWFNSDGWVANYQEEFDKLELMFTTSEWVRQTYKRDGVNISKIIPMHIGIDTQQFKPTNNPDYTKYIKRMLRIKNGDKMILTIGGDTTSKGAQEMLYALAEVDKEFKDWKYVCKSWPSECANEWREREIELAESLGIIDKVIFLNDEFSQEFMVHLLNAADIYAAPSRIEGYGMIQVEAMACGKPVISINKMGPGETILHQKTGFLAKVAKEVKLDQEWAYPSMGFRTKKIIPFDSPKTFAYRADVDELKEYTLKLLTDPELCRRMGEQARIHAVQNFDYRDISKRIVDITKNKLHLE
ncbi:MAG: glycosyltransferase family 4 protein [Nanoarchaeota archaeon]|nr:glycosyltransferase family 4 protein [Nanoarchaeota archaeon]MBU1622741.1 glycosyltransferase family 4 protein [Nanoarchaeota archaeon]